MATQKQIEANRRNARKSTGPKTAEGKAKASRNATRHGLLSRQVVLSDEDPAEYQEMLAALHFELGPKTQLERLLVNRIAAQQWRLARIPALEAELIEALRTEPTGEDAGLGAAWQRDGHGAYGGALGRLARYETSLERSVMRLTAELRKLQADRRRREEAEGAQMQAAHDARRYGPEDASIVAKRTRSGHEPLPLPGEGAGGRPPARPDLASLGADPGEVPRELSAGEFAALAPHIRRLREGPSGEG